METSITLAALLLGAGMVAGAAVMERRPRQSLEVRLISTTPVMFTGAVIALLALVHLVNIAGYVTGR